MQLQDIINYVSLFDKYFFYSLNPIRRYGKLQDIYKISEQTTVNVKNVIIPLYLFVLVQFYLYYLPYYVTDLPFLLTRLIFTNLKTVDKPKNG